jgi:hypothetical protein
MAIGDVMDVIDDLTKCELPRISRGWSEDGDLVAIDPPKNPEPTDKHEVQMFVPPCSTEGWVGQMYWYAPDMRANVVRVRNTKTGEQGWMAWSADVPDIKKYLETNDPGRFRKICPYNSSLYADDPNCKQEEIVGPVGPVGPVDPVVPNDSTKVFLLAAGSVAGGLMGMVGANKGGYKGAKKYGTVLGGALVGLLGGFLANNVYQKKAQTAGVGRLRERDRALRQLEAHKRKLYSRGMGYLPPVVAYNWAQRDSVGMICPDGVRRYG